MSTVKKQKKLSKPKVLLLENINSDAVKTFEDAGYQVVTHTKALSEQELIVAISDIAILGIRSKTKVTQSVIAAAPKLHAIGAFCIGTNQIDISACTAKGIAVFNAPYSNTRSVVELAIGEIIMLMRRTFPQSIEAHAGGWDKSSKGSYEIRGKKLGIIGYGNIGSQLSVVAEGLGMQVAFFDIQEKLALGNAKKMKTQKELLAWADVVTLHVDGRSENADLIDTPELKSMKKGAYLLNLSRGHVVVVEALAAALRSGALAGASVDVFPHEPKGNDEKFLSPLQGIPNVILTPHVGGSTEEAQLAIGQYVSAKLVSFSATGDSMLSVNFPQTNMPQQEKTARLIHIHANVPGMLAQINEVLAERKINVVGQSLRTNEKVGYAVVDFVGVCDTQLLADLSMIKGTIRVTHCN